MGMSLVWTFCVGGSRGGVRGAIVVTANHDVVLALPRSDPLGTMDVKKGLLSSIEGHLVVDKGELSKLWVSPMIAKVGLNRLCVHWP